MKSNNMLDILNNLENNEASKINEKASKSNNPLLGVLNELAAVENTEVESGIGEGNLAKDAHIEQENDIVVLCRDCNTAMLFSETESDACINCGGYNFIDIGSVAPEGTDDLNGVGQLGHGDVEPIMTNESAAKGDEEEEEDEDVSESIELGEATKKVIRNGQVVKVKIKTRKAKLSAGQKSALKKARKKANTASAKKARKKSMKVRSRKIHESSNLSESRDQYFLLTYGLDGFHIDLQRGKAPSSTVINSFLKDMFKECGLKLPEYYLPDYDIVGFKYPTLEAARSAAKALKRRVRFSKVTDGELMIEGPYEGYDLVGNTQEIISVRLGESIQLEEKGLGSTAKIIDAIGKAAKQLKITLAKEIEADASFAKFIDKKMNEVYKELVAKVPKVVAESATSQDEFYYVDVYKNGKKVDVSNLPDKEFNSLEKVAGDYAEEQSGSFVYETKEDAIDGAKGASKLYSKVVVVNQDGKVIKKFESKNESVELPDELIINESLGLAVVSDMASELETIAKELEFELAEDSYIKVVEGITLVLDASEGDVEGVVIYGIDATGETLSEEALAGVLAVAGIEFDVEEEEDLEEGCTSTMTESSDEEDEKDDEDSEDEEEEENK